MHVMPEFTDLRQNTAPIIGCAPLLKLVHWQDSVADTRAEAMSTVARDTLRRLRDGFWGSMATMCVASSAVSACRVRGLCTRTRRLVSSSSAKRFDLI